MNIINPVESLNAFKLQLKHDGLWTVSMVQSAKDWHNSYDNDKNKDLFNQVNHKKHKEQSGQSKNAKNNLKRN